MRNNLSAPISPEAMRVESSGNWRTRFCFLLALAMTTFGLRAEHFRINLSVEGPGEQTEAHADDSPPPEGLYPRPVFNGHAGDPLTLQFFMTDINPHDVLEHVTVHYFIVEEKKAGQKEVPELTRGVVLQGDFVMDFKPEGRAGLRQQFRIRRPGTYLLRVQSEHSKSDHEHFSAIDLQIE